MITKFKNLWLMVIEMLEAQTGFYEMKDIHIVYMYICVSICTYLLERLFIYGNMTADYCTIVLTFSLARQTMAPPLSTTGRLTRT